MFDCKEFRNYKYYLRLWKQRDLNNSHLRDKCILINYFCPLPQALFRPKLSKPFPLFWHRWKGLEKKKETFRGQIIFWYRPQSYELPLKDVDTGLERNKSVEFPEKKYKSTFFREARERERKETKERLSFQEFIVFSFSNDKFQGQHFLLFLRNGALVSHDWADSFQQYA